MNAVTPIEAQGETAEQRSHRVASLRMSRILREFSLLNNLATPNYRFSDSDVAKMLDAIRGATDDLENRFEIRNGKPKPGAFTF